MLRKKKSNRIKRSRMEQVIFCIAGCFLFVYAVSLVVPMLWLLMSSLKDFADYTLDLTAGHPFRLPTEWRFDNYSEAFEMMTVENTSFLGMVFNSLWQSIPPLAINTVISMSFAYTLAKFEFPGRNLIYSGIIAIMVIPIMTGGGALFKLYRDTGLYDNPLMYLVGAFGWGNFLYNYSFFKNVSGSYAEAVYIDGGGEFTAFFKVVFPQALSLILAMGVLGFISAWNNYLDVLLYMPSYPSVSSGLYILKNTFLRQGKDTIYYAGSVIAMIPTLVLFGLFSDKIMTNMSIGGLKG